MILLKYGSFETSPFTVASRKESLIRNSNAHNPSAMSITAPARPKNNNTPGLVKDFQRTSAGSPCPGASAGFEMS